MDEEPKACNFLHDDYDEHAGQFNVHGRLKIGLPLHVNRLDSFFVCVLCFCRLPP